MLLPLFKIDIYKKVFEGEELEKIQKEIESKIESISKDVTFDSWQGGDKIETTFAKKSDPEEKPDDIRKYELSYFHQKLDECVAEVVNGTPLQGIEMEDSWFNFYGRGGFQFAHDHMPSAISGVYYFATNGEDGDIGFINPVKLNEYEYTFQPQIGMLLLFPSYVEHKVYPNFTDQVRISASFNYK